jgi:hypothetical protein
MSSADRGNPIGTSAPWLRSRLRRYAFALITVAVATLMRAALGKLLGPNLPFIVFYPVIWLVAWMAGLGPAFFAVLLSAVSAHYLFFGRMRVGIVPLHHIGVAALGLAAVTRFRLPVLILSFVRLR